MLRATKSVTRACQTVRMSTVTAYALRKRPGAESFARAWDAALAFAPDPGPRSPRRLLCLAANRSQTNEVTETHDFPDSPAPPAQASSALQALAALLAELRAVQRPL